MRGLTPYHRFSFLICILAIADLSILILQIHCNFLLLKDRVRLNFLHPMNCAKLIALLLNERCCLRSKL